jgi:tRNA(adenine34) deaminase
MINDKRYMGEALALAGQAMARGDWPAGALIVRNGATVGRGNNRQVTCRDLTLHAETEALRNAFTVLGTTDLSGATLYASMEPCPMCAYAMRQAGIATLVLGARHADLGRSDLGRYSIETFCDLIGYALELRTGVLHAECVELRRRWGQDK